MTEGEGLLSHLVRRIRKTGPLTFAEFMSEALYHPAWGRYSLKTPPMGPDGDYMTSPEVDPAFGLLLGRAISEMAGRTDAREFTIAEMGPGRGTLCRDILTGLDAEDRGLGEGVRYVLVEESETLRAEQRSLLAGARLLDRVSWASWRDLIRQGLFRGCFLANEFLDALPVHLVEWSGGRLREIHVSVDDTGCLCEVAAEPSRAEVARYFDDLGVTLSEGQRAEVNLAALQWMVDAAGLLSSGYAVVIDYGHEAGELFSERHFAGTLVGYRRHHLVTDPLDDPGAHDLTSHVDFTSLARAAKKAGFESWAVTNQRKVLTAMGLAELIADLSAPVAGIEEGERLRRRLALHSLMSPSGMGETFKVLIFGKGVPVEGLQCLRDRFRGTEAEVRR